MCQKSDDGLTYTVKLERKQSSIQRQYRAFDSADVAFDRTVSSRIRPTQSVYCGTSLKPMSHQRSMLVDAFDAPIRSACSGSVFPLRTGRFRSCPPKAFRNSTPFLTSPVPAPLSIDGLSRRGRQLDAALFGAASQRNSAEYKIQKICTVLDFKADTKSGYGGLRRRPGRHWFCCGTLQHTKPITCATMLKSTGIRAASFLCFFEMDQTCRQNIGLTTQKPIISKRFCCRTRLLYRRTSKAFSAQSNSDAVSYRPARLVHLNQFLRRRSAALPRRSNPFINADGKKLEIIYLLGDMTY